MSTKSQLTCECGRRIVMRDVLHKEHCMRVFTPGFVYVKYLCSDCRRSTERFVPNELWDDDMLRDVPGETSKSERQQFETLGEIGVEEVIDFHYELERASLSDLLKGF